MSESDHVERFLSRLDQRGPDECWPYLAKASTRSGHVQLWANGRQLLAHRYAYEHFIGPIPEGLLVCHRCDNPPCCNPAHLFLGTVADNNADRDRKGRQRSVTGEDHGNTTLTADQVRAIRRALAEGTPQRRIAEAYGVHQGTISNIARRVTWGHLP